MSTNAPCLNFPYSGQPKQFIVQFRTADNFPLDVYFLLDVTGSFSQRIRTTLPPLVTDLCMGLIFLDLSLNILLALTVSRLSHISEDYAVAFGGFGDKRAIPYALPSQDPRVYYNYNRYSLQYVLFIMGCIRFVNAGLMEVHTVHNDNCYSCLNATRPSVSDILSNSHTSREMNWRYAIVIAQLKTYDD